MVHSRHRDLYRLSDHSQHHGGKADIEGTLRSGDWVTGLEVKIEGQSLQEAGSLSDLLSELKGKG